jgi:uncharacterized membrane-anchored protein YhcB (DUF1043 family)
MNMINFILFIWRSTIMVKNTMNVVKGISAGLIAGAVVGYVGSQMKQQPKKTKKKAVHAVNAVESLLDNVQAMLKS